MLFPSFRIQMEPWTLRLLPQLQRPPPLPRSSLQVDVSWFRRNYLSSVQSQNKHLSQVVIDVVLFSPLYVFYSSKVLKSGGKIQRTLRGAANISHVGPANHLAEYLLRVSSRASCLVRVPIIERADDNSAACRFALSGFASSCYYWCTVYRIFWRFRPKRNVLHRNPDVPILRSAQRAACRILGDRGRRLDLFVACSWLLQGWVMAEEPRRGPPVVEIVLPSYITKPAEDEKFYPSEVKAIAQKVNITKLSHDTNIITYEYS